MAKSSPIMVKRTMQDRLTKKKIIEEIPHRPQRESFGVPKQTVPEMAKDLGVSPEIFRKLVNTLAKNPELLRAFNNRVNQTLAHDCELADDEPYEPIRLDGEEEID